MLDLNHFQKLITDRLVELDVRIHEVDHELGEPKSADLNEQAIDIEDD
jgi:DnaK suppressor protein